MRRNKILFIYIICLLSFGDVCPQIPYCGDAGISNFKYDIFRRSYNANKILLKATIRKGDYFEFGRYLVFFKELYYDELIDGCYTNVNVCIYFSRKRDRKGFNYYISANPYPAYDKIFEYTRFIITGLRLTEDNNFEIDLALIPKAY